MGDEKSTVLLMLGLGFVLGGLFVWLFLRGSAGAQVRARRVLYSPVVTYTNEEEWEIVRDERGRVSGVRVHRKAREGEAA